MSDHSNDTPWLEDIGLGLHTARRYAQHGPKNGFNRDDVAKLFMVDTLPSAIGSASVTYAERSVPSSFRPGIGHLDYLQLACVGKFPDEGS